MRIRVKIILTVFFSLSIFLFLDRFLFPEILFRIPNELEWDTSPWYNFLRKRSEIRFSDRENGVLLLGSSVALYSVLPEKFEERVNESLSVDKKIRAEFYAHPSLTPSDFYYYKEDIASKKPKAIVYIINPADFQLEYLKQNPNGAQYDEKDFFADSVHTRHQNRLLYPDRFFLERWKEILSIGKSEAEVFASKFLSYAVRYRSFFYDPIVAWYMHRFRWGRSYHYYTGIRPKEGIYLRGWTKKNFEIDCEIGKQVWKDSVFIQKPGTTLRISRLMPKEEIVFEKKYEKKGWYYLEIPFSDSPTKTALRFEADKTASSKEVDDRIFGSKEEYGIRLSQNFCRADFREGISYSRISGFDDSRVESMSDSDYDKDYNFRIYRNNDAEDVLSRFKKLRTGKRILSEQKRFLSWSQMDYLKKGVRYLLEKNIRVILIHSPENPKEKKEYDKSPWYKGYLSFLRTLGEDGYEFVDKGDLFPRKQSFLDPHHLTYSASEIASRDFAESFLRSFASGSSESGRNLSE